MDRGLVAQIAVAEAVGERRLLVKNHEEMHEEEKAKGEKNNRRRGNEQPGPEDDCRGTEVHRVADVAIRPEGNEFAWRVEGCRSSAPDGHERGDASCGDE